jgi:hypothetical protein
MTGVRPIRLDPVERAREIVDACLAREFYGRGSTFSGADLNTVVRAFAMYRATFGIGALRDRRRKRSPSHDFERVAAVVLCSVVTLVGVAWLIASAH